ncbi:MAG: amylo-alpha-1,6-glucosidase, partial [Synechococcaceae cyanobacterium]|nr:amylo-alpha-1,6-glucosidase [Synechococcaceae cyanobacterium]
WFGDWGRDTMISLAGLTLLTGRVERAERILRTWAGFLRDGLLPNLFPEGTAAGEEPPGYNSADATLWFFEALRQHRRASGSDGLIGDLFPQLEAVLRHHLRGTRFGISVDPADGLLRAGAGQLALTWMDARPGPEPITPRHGKPVEVNALWVNALRAMAGFAAALGRDPAPWNTLADRAARGFQRFWSEERGHCLDGLDGPTGDDASLRPNQLLAISLPEPLLSRSRGERVLEVCRRRLLTPFGLRSLDPADPRYRGTYAGDGFLRDGAYHQGTVWAWWIGPFVRAHLRVHGDPGAARRFLEPLADHLGEACVGSISEIFDGDPPHRPRGCFAQAWSVAEVLAAWAEVERPLHP